MVAIGFRASPNEVYYAIVRLGEDGKSEVISSSKVNIPLSLEFPEQLNFLRKTVKDIIFEYGAVRAGIRITENTAQSTNIPRISFEAILQELICSSSIEKYFVGQIANISAKLGIERTEFKTLIASKNAKCNNVSLAKFNEKEKEAILVALASLNLK